MFTLVRVKNKMLTTGVCSFHEMNERLYEA